MIIYLLRHGETQMNQERKYYGVLNVPLNEQGIQQATEFSYAFRKVHFDRILTSPLKRASDTARLIAKQSDGPLEVDQALAEQNLGIFEGKDYQGILADYPEEFDQWNQDWLNQVPPGGESTKDVYQRTRSFMERLLTEEEEHTGNQTVLLVGHMGTLRHISTILLQLPVSAYWNFTFEQGCYSRFDIEDGCAIVRKINQSVKGVDNIGSI